MKRFMVSSKLIKEKVNQVRLKYFNIISRLIVNHYQTILNYFYYGFINTSVESLNVKIKIFMSKFRGVRKIKFFLFILPLIIAIPRVFNLVH
ncbi:Transposase [Flavobacterium frigoris]|uniref:Transposase n=2 Tax=Flavobacterium frigoris TaxID=229204 RepID=A0A1H9MBN2_FLAFI|nr:Transposase [Flavobacterium frigoris]